MSLIETLAEDRQTGVPLTIEPSSAKVNYGQTNVYVTAIIRRKQKPKRTGKYPSWFNSKKIQRDYKACFSSGQALYERNRQSETHLLELVKKLNTRSAVIYAIDHKTISDKKKKSGYSGEANDVDGLIEFRAVDTNTYAEDDQSSSSEKEE